MQSWSNKCLCVVHMEGWSRVRLRSHKLCCSVSPVPFGLTDMITLVPWNSDVDKSPMGVAKNNTNICSCYILFLKPCCQILRLSSNIMRFSVFEILVTEKLHFNVVFRNSTVPVPGFVVKFKRRQNFGVLVS